MKSLTPFLFAFRTTEESWVELKKYRNQGYTVNGNIAGYPWKHHKVKCRYLLMQPPKTQ